MQQSRPAEPAYRGRFAPSPTGPLHLGSLLTAAASYIDALAHGGEWLVRIEDIDPQREAPGAAGQILDSLHAHGFRFPEPLRQSQQLPLYDALLSRLVTSGNAYPCSCNRQHIEQHGQPGRAGLIYPGTCRERHEPHAREPRAVRMRLPDECTVCFEDRLQGRQCCDMVREIGDFTLRRGDGLVAYQTAVTHDDAAQRITHVVRGADLLEATFMQLMLFRVMEENPPIYMHIPVIIGADGEKLSKQSGAAPIDNKNINFNLLYIFSALGLNTPSQLRRATPESLWNWAAEHWQPQKLAGMLSLPGLQV